MQHLELKEEHVGSQLGNHWLRERGRPAHDDRGGRRRRVLELLRLELQAFQVREHTLAILICSLVNVLFYRCNECLAAATRLTWIMVGVFLLILGMECRFA
jgi:hypothetical protein